MIFKVGDRVKAIDHVAGINLARKAGIVCDILPGDSYPIGVEFEEKFSLGHDCNGKCKYGYGRYGAVTELLLVESNTKNTMNLKEQFAMLMKGEPEKSFFKAGITKSDYNFTPEGMEIFMQWLLKKYGEEFKKDVVDPILAAKEDK